MVDKTIKIKKSKSKRKCPKNGCDNANLKVEILPITGLDTKMSLICLNCFHRWRTNAKYAQALPMATEEEIDKMNTAVVKNFNEKMAEIYPVKLTFADPSVSDVRERVPTEFKLEQVSPFEPVVKKKKKWFKPWTWI